MPDSARIDDLRRRVQKDPASIAFAQLAEELRRAGQMEEAVETCRAGLALHPSYLSARVTLGRALVELNLLDDAAEELGIVLRSAPENLAAMRAMGEVHQRRGNMVEALAQFREALTIARNDPDLEETVADLSRTLEPKKPAASADHLSQFEFLQHLPAAPVRPPKPPIPVTTSAPATESVAAVEPVPSPVADAPVELAPRELTAHELTPIVSTLVESVPVALADSIPVGDDLHAIPVDESASRFDEATPTQEEIERDRASRTIVALQRWLDVIHDARPDLRA